MLMAIATTGKDFSSPLDPRFGRAQGFLIVDADRNEIVEYISNPNVSAGGGAGISTAQMLANRGVRVVIAGAVGPNAFGVLNSAGIAMYSTAGLSTVQNAIDAFAAGKLNAIKSPAAAGHQHKQGNGFGRNRW